MAARNVPNVLKTINVTVLPQHQLIRLLPQLCPEIHGRCSDNALYPLADIGALQAGFAVLCHDGCGIGTAGEVS